jgi:uncharacterized protein (DUF1778 family)
MPINHAKCLRYKDTWAAPGSQLYEALENGDKAKAEAIYQECEVAFKRLTGRDFKKITDAIDTPPQPNDALKGAMSKFRKQEQ